MNSPILKKPFSFYIKVFAGISFLLAIIGSIFIIYLVHFYIKSLPNIDSLLNYKPLQVFQVYDDNNHLITEWGNEKRIYVPIEQVPEIIKNAFIATEDKTFYTNCGIDFFGFFRAVAQNIVIFFTLKSNGQRYVGASTISQQLVRNTILSKERTLIRKIKEMILAYKINQKLSKDKILEIYLNHIYLGHHSYGIATAARTYFQKNLDKLTLSEIAFLASLPKAPSALDPAKNLQRVIDRRNWVLKRMLVEKFITEDQMNKAINSELIFKYNANTNTISSFLDYVRTELPNYLLPEEVIKGGYVINTTLNQKWQQISQKALSNWLDKYAITREEYRGTYGFIDLGEQADHWLERLKKITPPPRSAHFMLAVVLNIIDAKEAIIGLIDGNTGSILIEHNSWPLVKIDPSAHPSTPIPAVPPEKMDINNVVKVGDVVLVKPIASNSSKKLYLLSQPPEIDGAVVILSNKTGKIKAMVGGYEEAFSNFNRAFQAKRQTGSLIKVLVYLAALEKGVLPTDIFMDAPIKFNIHDGQVWTPSNVTSYHRGPVTLRTGLEKSINVVTLRVAEKAGISNVIDVIYRLQAVKNEKIAPHLGVSIGLIESDLLSMSQAFAIIANEGKYIKPTSIMGVKSLDGKNISFLQDVKAYSKEAKQDPKDDDLKDNLLKENIKNYNFVPGEQVVDEQVIYQLINLMKGVVTRGTAAKMLKPLEMNIAGKTGTSQNGRDLWFIGFTPDITIGVYIGYDTERSTVSQFGATMGVPVFKDILEQLKPDLKLDKDFSIPQGVRIVKVDPTTGKRAIGEGGDFVYEVFTDKNKLPDFPTDEKDTATLEVEKNNNNSVFDGIY